MAEGQKSLIISDLSGGIVDDPPKYKLEPGEAQQMRNFFVKRRGSLKLRGNLRYPSGISGFAASVYITGFIRFRSGLNSYIVFGRAGGGGDGTWAYNENTGGFTFLSPVILYDAICMDNRVIWISRGVGNAAWWWDGTTVATLGLAPPTTIVTTAATVGPGTLDSENLPPYSHFVTFVNSIGVESNPTQLLNPGGGPWGSIPLAVHLKFINITNIPIGPAGVVDRYIYRLGGLLTRPTLVLSLGDNTSTTTQDGPADRDVGTIYLSNSHDTPPAGITVIGKVKNRAVLAKGTTVYVSNLAEPDYYPNTVTFPQTDGIIFEMDNDETNPVVAISESGSAGVIHRSRGMWILQGEDIDSFTLTKVCDIGILAYRTAVMCGNVYVWQGPDGMVYALSAEGPVELGLDIESALSAIPEAERANACACYHNRSYHLCVPRAPGTLPFYRVFSFVYNKWVDLSEQFVGATQLYSELGEVDVDEILFATKSGYVDYFGATTSGNRGIAAQFGPSGLSSFGFDWWSGDYDMDSPSDLKKAVNLRIMGTWLPSGNQQAFATVYSTMDRQDGTQTIVSHDYPITQGGPGTRLNRNLRADLVGQRLSVRMRGSGLTMNLDSVELDYTGEGQRTV